MTKSDNFTGQRSDYEIAFEVFKRLTNLQTDQELAQKLVELRPHLKYLRSSYGAHSITVEYQDNVLLAYLLAYVPPYIEMAERSLEKIRFSNKADSILEVALIGAGPIPEAAAIVNLLQSQDTRYEEVRLHLFDHASKDWEPIRRELIVVLNELFDCGRITYQSHNFDLTTPSAFVPFERVLQRCTAVIAQNCMNETLSITSKSSLVTNNLLELQYLLPRASVLVIADQSAYSSVSDRLTAFESQLDDQVDALSRFSEKRYFRHSVRACPLLETFFFQSADGLWQRRHVNFGVTTISIPNDCTRPRSTSLPSQPSIVESNLPLPQRVIQMEKARLVRRNNEARKRRLSLERTRGVVPNVRRELSKIASIQGDLNGIVTRFSKSGVFVDLAGVEVFIDKARLELTASHEPLANYLGRSLSFQLISVEANFARGSRQSYLRREQLAFVQSIKVGSKILGKVVDIRDHDAVVECCGERILIRVGEICHEWIERPSDRLGLNEIIEIEIIEIYRSGPIFGQGSMKRCFPDPMIEFDRKHNKGELVLCEVTAVNQRFAILNLLGIQARLHASQIPSEPADCRDALTEGEEVWARYLGFNPQGNRGRYLQVSMSNIDSQTQVAAEFAQIWPNWTAAKE
jgi:predicted RNA-binding protein with RPS1 domain